MSRRIVPFFSIGFCILSGIGTAADAQILNSTVQVAARAAAFVSPAISGSITAAIIYEPGDAGSEKDARDLERLMSGGLHVGSMTLAPKRVSTNALEQLSGARIAFVTEGADSKQVASATAARSILSIGFDPDCTRAGYCVLAISDGPRVQIIVSKAASAAAKLRFDSSFLLLIKEI